MHVVMIILLDNKLNKKPVSNVADFDKVLHVPYISCSKTRTRDSAGRFKTRLAGCEKTWL